jgi:hypothetical protein
MRSSRLAARYRARAVAAIATRETNLLLVSGLVLLGIAYSLMTLLG